MDNALCRKPSFLSHLGLPGIVRGTLFLGEYSRSREVICDALVSAPDVPVHVRDGTLEPGVSGQCVVHSKYSFFVLSDYPKICWTNLEQSLRCSNRTDQVWVIMFWYIILEHTKIKL